MARVSVEYKDHVAFVTLTRGDKMNALDQAMFQAIIAAGQEVAASDARAVVLSGEGKSFCAGLDVANFAAFAGQDPVEMLMPRSHGDTNDFQEVAMVWRRVPVPVIAALHGAVYGGGLQIALGADIRIAAPDTRLSVLEMKWGLIPDMGGMVLLPQLVRSDVLRLLTYTARPIGAEKAAEWGLVTDLADDPLAEATALAQEIAGKSPSAIRSAKRLIDQAEAMSREEVLLAESQEQAQLIGKPDQMEVIAAQMQGRAPVFK
ncbi:crotonase/enoyl-CoA hydratase family protein [Ruegeria pomeroyi]|uniref:Enoyl-CoA hydratase/isomerase family protein n=2 Tax=Ruegeria pomeroyi TaxID=89184 RepID=Q5LP27_RUEPO|nr:crotonase/enoyl-CoA hydratase family protein [Ruegeria pomeroyi]HCE72520.1 crotonase/enoyl-CoA hydratase family protein [Ruegeria sp.]AAV96261.1 enoyl-CoA hydratase/isomerase family protein [Ruegeria pomeroyi DSS-3]NVK99098.1 crotonase/enoyl-CoA hydratase family protein [Ruegeria pomeroyi]NVL02331.1 crotonase/enoyl-CoA hydratase family protein [Ruegeria pomeroyi]QWV09811.1 crotonase/enoyl-CoA hydratase family protein [Ruegeria pomeroyi]